MDNSYFFSGRATRFGQFGIKHKSESSEIPAKAFILPHLLHFTSISLPTSTPLKRSLSHPWQRYSPYCIGFLSVVILLVYLNMVYSQKKQLEGFIHKLFFALFLKPDANFGVVIHRNAVIINLNFSIGFNF